MVGLAPYCEMDWRLSGFLSYRRCFRPCGEAENREATAPSCPSDRSFSPCGDSRSENSARPGINICTVEFPGRSQLHIDKPAPGRRLDDGVNCACLLLQYRQLDSHSIE